MMNYPEIVVLFSGKRKCGKDFIAEKLLKMYEKFLLVSKFEYNKPLFLILIDLYFLFNL